MSSRAEAGPSTRPGPPGPGNRPPPVLAGVSSLRSRLGLAALLALALCLSHPQTWGGRDSLWAPSAGLGLTLIAWIGIWNGVPLLIAGALLVLGQYLVRSLLPWGGGLELAPTLLLAVHLLLGVVEAPLAWWLYSTRGQGSRRLSDPGSATLFLFLVPGAVLVGFALLRAGLRVLLEDEPPAGPSFQGFLLLFLHDWLQRALGVLIVAPPLLVSVTPWLLRHKWIRPEPHRAAVARPDRQNSADRTRYSAETLPLAATSHWGDWVEVIGLAIGAGILCLLLGQVPNRRELLGWHLWGVQLLLILWASMRQGLRGGTLVAAVAASLPLVALPSSRLNRPEDPLFALLIQGHLLAQCAAALLIAAAARWVRLSEAGYGRVVSHIPVVIYSARLRRDLSAWRPTALQSGESGLGVAEVTLVSAASLQLLGCQPEQLLGDYNRWLGCVHPDDRELLLAALSQLARQEQPVTCEYRVLSGESSGSRRSPSHASNPSHQNGVVPQPALRYRWLRDILAPSRDSEGRLVGWEGVVTDITEQRALADDLRRTTSMFHALVANLPTGVFFIQGPFGQPILVNARARQLLGQREDAAAGLEHLSRVYRLHRTDGTPYPVEELPVYQALRDGRTTMRDDVVVHRPDGRRIPLVTWGAPVNLGGGRGVADAAVWVMEDLTALRQAEAARKDSESRLRAVFETMAEGLVVQDRRGVILDCNPAASAFLGMSAEQILGRTLFDLSWTFTREDGSLLPNEEHPGQSVLRTGRPVRNVVLGIRRNGLCRWVLLNVVPLGVIRDDVCIDDPDGPTATTATHERQPAGAVTTFSDISAYIHARQAIQASEERYRGLVETLPVMLVQSDRNLRVTEVNPAYRTGTGLSLAEVCEPHVWTQRVHPEDLQKLLDVAHSTLAGEPGRLEFRFRIKDGSERIFFALTQPHRQEGEVVGVVTLMLDMTRERQLERDLQRSQRLELIGQLSSGVAHDFNNLLSVVLNLADLARSNLPPEHPVHADLTHITEASEQAAGLAGQLLALSRNRRVSTRRTNLQFVVRRTLELLRSSQPAHLRIESELAAEDLFVRADDTQLQQVLMNLCLNARDAMPGGGVLRVRTERTLAQGRPYVVLSVIDTGAGMPEEVRLRIFEPFFTTKETGTGLGLAVVRQIVEAAGGRIEVSSEVGRGSRFDVWWPADNSEGS